MPRDATDGILINVLGNDTGTGLRVVQINGIDISADAPLAVADGFVQLRALDGQLLFTANTNFSGAATFAYTIADSANRMATRPSPST